MSTILKFLSTEPSQTLCSLFPGFGFGTIMLDGFRLARFIEDDDAINCFGPLYIAQIALRVVLVFSETLFMTKNHKVRVCTLPFLLSV